MNAPSLPHQRIALVSTRDLSQNNGRTQILGPVIRALKRHHRVDILPLRSVLQTRKPCDIAGVLLAWGKSLLAGKPLPLQCLLYASRFEAERLAELIRRHDYDVVYLDTVRCQILLRALRRKTARHPCGERFRRSDVAPRRLPVAPRPALPVRPCRTANAGLAALADRSAAGPADHRLRSRHPARRRG